MPLKENETDKENMTLKENVIENETVKETETVNETEVVNETEIVTLAENETENHQTETQTETVNETESEALTETETLNETDNEDLTETQVVKENVTQNVPVKENMTLKEKHFEISLDWISKKSATSIKTNSEGYEAPKSYTNKETGEKIHPDFSFQTQSGYTCFTEIALKSESPRKLVTRWKLLSLMANAKRGKLHLLAPKGHKMFTKKLVDNHNINAIVHSI